MEYYDSKDTSKYKDIQSIIDSLSFSDKSKLNYGKEDKFDDIDKFYNIK